MNSSLRNRKQLKLVGVLTACLLSGAVLFLAFSKTVWHTVDYKALDIFYRRAIDAGRGAEASFKPQIVILTLTDDTYGYFRKNYLDRKDLARINKALARFSPQATAFDFIFAMPGDPESDEAFAESLRNLDVFLPVGCAVAETPVSFQWRNDKACEKFRSDYLCQPRIKGNPTPLYGSRALVSLFDFTRESRPAGDIGAHADPDGVFRHAPMLLKVDGQYLPAFSLAIFLNWAGVSPGDMIVEWGKSITIPHSVSRRLDTDVVIPINERGMAFVPFLGKRGDGFSEISAHAFLEASEDEYLRGNLMEIFQGNIVFFAEVASGISDMGATPLESGTPLVVIHTSMLNALLTNTFYAKWSFASVVLTIFLVSLLLGFSGIFRSSWVLYGTFFSTLSALAMLTWIQFVRFNLFPVVTVGSFAILVFLVLLISLELATSRERSFIQNAFSRYVPEQVVRELTNNPDVLRLGGEEREVTVFFSDIAGFTSISEKMTPPELVSLLNEFLTEMTAIIMEEGGIIDKFQGDAIMAEFGIPISIPDHANKAVMAGLRMQDRLAELRKKWRQEGKPDLYCRIGINTGRVSVGNMGSDKVLDYTVIGDAVNLASRLEGANKNYGTSLMISENTLKALTPGLFKTRILDIVQVKGKTESITVFEVYGYGKNDSIHIREEYYKIYDEAFRYYSNRNFTAAEKGFRQALSLKPDDPAAQKMLERIVSIKPESLPEEWDGSIKLNTK